MGRRKKFGRSRSGHGIWCVKNADGIIVVSSGMVSNAAENEGITPAAFAAADARLLGKGCYADEAE